MNESKNKYLPSENIYLEQIPVIGYTQIDWVSYIYSILYILTDYSEEIIFDEKEYP